MDALDQPVAVGEIVAQEPNQRIACHGLVGGVHGHLAEKVFCLGVQHDERSETVPQIIQRIEALGVLPGLVGGLHERAAQFDGAGQEAPPELLAETEIVFGREVARVRGGADDEPIAAHDFLGRGVPDDKLVVAVAREVFLVDVDFAAGAAPGAAERQFAQAPDFAHQRRAFGCGENIDFVVGFLRIADFALGRQLLQQQGPVHGWRDGLFG